MKKLSWMQIVSVSFMLFAMFFGAGNMIFPPAMGQLAGSNYLWALLGFILTDAGIAVLGVAAVVFIGNSMSDIGRLVSKKFAIIFGIGVYLLIGPLFALPRTGSVSFEMAILPYIDGSNKMFVSLLFTAIFFIVTFYLSSNPKRIVDIVGKILTPVLLLSIALIFIFSVLNINQGSDIVFQQMQVPTGDYASIPFFQGMVEGYNALDGPAGLAFALVVISAIKRFGIEDKKSIAKYTVLCGLGSAILLGLTYFGLTYVGAITGTTFANGGALLHGVSNHLFGGMGGVVLGVAVLFACLTTSIGLTTSFADYFHTEFPKYSYKKLAIFVCAFSFVIANIGLSQLIAISLPILMMVYPVSVVLVILSFFRKKIGKHRGIYIGAMVLTFCVSFFDGMQGGGIVFPSINGLLMRLPFYELHLGWIIPAIIGGVIGYFYPVGKNNGVEEGYDTI